MACTPKSETRSRSRTSGSVPVSPDDKRDRDRQEQNDRQQRHRGRLRRRGREAVRANTARDRARRNDRRMPDAAEQQQQRQRRRGLIRAESSRAQRRSIQQPAGAGRAAALDFARGFRETIGRPRMDDSFAADRSPGPRQVLRRADRALDGVTLSIAPGEILGLLGPNGAGKTTFVRSVVGRVRPDSGRSARVRSGAGRSRGVGAARMGAAGDRPLSADLGAREPLQRSAATRASPNRICPRRPRGASTGRR